MAAGNHRAERPHYSARTPELNNQKYLQFRLGVEVHMAARGGRVDDSTVEVSVCSVSSSALVTHCTPAADPEASLQLYAGLQLLFISCLAPVPGLLHLSCSELPRDTSSPWSSS